MAASEFRVLDLPLEPAACRDVAGEWVPEVEAHQLPQHFATACAACPLRQACLTLALECELEGYWAGTTTAQRRALRRRHSPDAVIKLAQPSTAHAPGAGSEYRYKRGCRCLECAEAHRIQRAGERARKPLSEAA